MLLINVNIDSIFQYFPTHKTKSLIFNLIFCETNWTTHILYIRIDFSKQYLSLFTVFTYMFHDYGTTLLTVHVVLKNDIDSTK